MQKGFLFSLFSLLILSSCSQELSQDVYSTHNVGQASETYEGTIVNTKVVTVQEADKIQDNQAGLVIGGVSGAALGSMLGGDAKGKTIGGLVGGLAGALGGAFAQKKLSQQQAMQYVVRLDNGSNLTVVQSPKPAMSVGQRVFVIKSGNRARVNPQ